DPDLAAMALYQVPGEPEPEARSLDAGHVVPFHAEELAEHLRKLLLGDAHALVGNGEENPILLFSRFDAHLAAVGRVLQRVTKQVVEHLLDLTFVAADLDVIFNTDDDFVSAHVGALALEPDHAGDDRVDVRDREAEL